MASACTFDVIYMNATALEDPRSVFEEAGFIKTISMDVALDILLFANAANGVQYDSTIKLKI